MTLEPDVALPTLDLDTQVPGPGSPYGVTAQVRAPNGAPLAGQSVVFTVTRGTNTNALATYINVSNASGNVVLNPPGTPPSGPLTVRADLYDADGTVIRTATTVVNVTAFTLTADPDGLTARAGTTFALPAGGLRATLMDGASPVEDWPVTFTVAAGRQRGGCHLPGRGLERHGGHRRERGGPGSDAHHGHRRRWGVQGDGLDERSARDLARVGLEVRLRFLRVAGEQHAGCRQRRERQPAAEVPGAGEQRPGRARLRGVRVGQPGGAALACSGTDDVWQAKTGLATYDATANIFQINLKTTSLGMKKGTVYVVEVRVLASGSDPKPGGYDAVGGQFDLGRTTLLVKAEVAPPGASAPR